MRVGTVTLVVGLIVLIAHTSLATTEGYTSEAGSVQKQEKCAGKTQVKLEIEGGIEGCKTVGENGGTIEIGSGEIKAKDIKSGVELKVRIVGKSCGSKPEELTVEEALKAASSEEEKAVEEREVEEYMNHEQGGSFLICMSAEYRKKLEVELREKYEGKWEVYYWTTLLRDVDLHYSGNMSVSDRAKLREEYKKKYGVSWRLYYWRYVSQSIEYHLDGSKIEELKTKYGKKWRFYYEAYGHWFSYKHEVHRKWFEGLTEADFEGIGETEEPVTGEMSTGASNTEGVGSEQVTTVTAGGSSGATELTIEEALEAALSEEEKAVEEREVEEYMDHEQGGSFLICMSAEYRKKLEVELKEKHGAKWEVYYWTTLLRDVDVHYSGNMSVSERVELREEYKKKYGVSWRLYYWRYVSQSIEYHLDGSKIEELKTKYGEEWRFYYEAYGHWFSYKHEDHREWFKGLTEKDFEDIAKQVELAEAEEKMSEKERSVDIYMDHVGTGKDGMKYADSMSKEWRENLAKDLKVKYGEQWEIPYWMQMTTDIDENYQGPLSSDDRTKLRWSVIMKYGNDWRKYYWRVLSQDMEMYLDGDLINSLKAQYNDHWRLHYGPYSQRFVQNELGD